eukprot:CFRG5920T1
MPGNPAKKRNLFNELLRDEIAVEYYRRISPFLNQGVATFCRAILSFYYMSCKRTRKPSDELWVHVKQLVGAGEEFDIDEAKIRKQLKSMDGKQLECEMEKDDIVRVRFVTTEYCHLCHCGLSDEDSKKVQETKGVNDHDRNAKDNDTEHYLPQIVLCDAFEIVKDTKDTNNLDYTCNIGAHSICFTENMKGSILQGAEKIAMVFCTKHVPEMEKMLSLAEMYHSGSLNDPKLKPESKKSKSSYKRSVFESDPNAEPEPKRTNTSSVLSRSVGSQNATVTDRKGAAHIPETTPIERKNSELKSRDPGKLGNTSVSKESATLDNLRQEQASDYFSDTSSAPSPIPLSVIRHNKLREMDKNINSENNVGASTDAISDQNRPATHPLHRKHFADSRVPVVQEQYCIHTPTRRDKTDMKSHSHSTSNTLSSHVRNESVDKHHAGGRNVSDIIANKSPERAYNEKTWDSEVNVSRQAMHVANNVNHDSHRQPRDKSHARDTSPPSSWTPRHHHEQSFLDDRQHASSIYYRQEVDKFTQNSRRLEEVQRSPRQRGMRSPVFRKQYLLQVRDKACEDFGPGDVVDIDNIIEAIARQQNDNPVNLTKYRKEMEMDLQDTISRSNVPELTLWKKKNDDLRYQIEIYSYIHNTIETRARQETAQVSRARLNFLEKSTELNLR